MYRIRFIIWPASCRDHDRIDAKVYIDSLGSIEHYNFEFGRSNNITAKLKNKFSKKKKFTRFVKGKLTFDKKGLVQFEVFEGQESYKIEPFVKSNAWGVFKDGVSVFNRGNLIEVYSASGLNEFLIS